MTPEEINEFTKRIYNKHTKRDDGRCPGYHEAGSFVNEVLPIESDFIEELCKEIQDMEISKERYEELLDAEMKLSCLEAGGVDNWDWYSESLEEYWDWKEKREVTKDEQI